MLMNAQVLTRTSVIPTLYVPTPLDLMFVVALEDLQGMAKYALVIMYCTVSFV